MVEPDGKNKDYIPPLGIGLYPPFLPHGEIRYLESLDISNGRGHLAFVHCLAIARSATIDRRHIPGTIIKNLPFRSRLEQGETSGYGCVENAATRRIRILLSE